MKNFTIFVVNFLNNNFMRLKNETVNQTISKTFSIKTTSDNFFFQFYTLLQEWIGLNNTQKNVLVVLCTKTTYNTNQVSLNKYLKDEICEICDIKYQTLANTLQDLKKKDIITVVKGECFINETYFWKGDLKTREKALKENKLFVKIEFED